MPRHPRDARSDAWRLIERVERVGGGSHVGVRSTSRRSRSDPRFAAPASCWVSTRSMSPTKGSSSPSFRPGRRPLVAVMRDHPLGRDAAIIGEVVAEHPGMVTMRSVIGGERVVTMLAGEQLPRIC